VQRDFSVLGNTKRTLYTFGFACEKQADKLRVQLDDVRHMLPNGCCERVGSSFYDSEQHCTEFPRPPEPLDHSFRYVTDLACKHCQLYMDIH
jgi:hypothetical protein